MEAPSLPVQMYRVGRTCYPASASVPLALEHIDVVQHDYTKDVDALLVLALQLRSSTEPLTLCRGIRGHAYTA